MLFSSAVLFASTVAAVAASPSKSVGKTNTFTPTNYTVVPGLFVQDNADFDSSKFVGFHKDNFGIIDKSRKRWTDLEKKVKELNRNADSQTAYKLIYLARHGEGYHNLAESTYGKEAWNCYWSLINGDGNITWGPDPLLTPKGTDQAYLARDTFTTELALGMPMPQVLYSSPMRRSASTLEITWDKYISSPKGHKGKKSSKGLTPIVIEHLRESIGLHTCDKRSDKGVIAATYPRFEFEEPFSFHDQLYTDEYQEAAHGQQTLRMQQWLNKVFATDDSSVISITAHSGVMRALFRVINHNLYSVETGGVVPILIKAVGHPSATNAAIIGGPSNLAPSCASTVSLPAGAFATAAPTARRV